MLMIGNIILIKQYSYYFNSNYINISFYKKLNFYKNEKDTFQYTNIKNMVCLNEKLPIDYGYLRKIFVEELAIILDNELNCVYDIKNDRKEKIKNNIIEEFKNRVNSNNIIERIIHKDHCIHKYKKGKKDGNICCKKITKNGNKKKYVCTIHNKDHVPKKKILKNNTNNKSIDLLNNINESEIMSKLTNSRVDKNFIKSKKISKIEKHNNVCKTSYIKDFNIIKFNNEIKNFYSNYKNTICKYREYSLCQNIINKQCCLYKHIEKDFLLHDYINKSNNLLIV